MLIIIKLKYIINQLLTGNRKGLFYLLIEIEKFLKKTKHQKELMLLYIELNNELDFFESIS